MTEHEAEYHENMVAMLELIWGKGYMAPGGPGNVAKLLDGTEPQGKQILDIGCAGGRNAVFLAEKGVDVVATDGSAAMVARTRDRLAAVLGQEEAVSRATQAFMDATPGARDASFDLVVALGIYHNARSPEEWERALAETARVLKAGGASWSRCSPPTPTSTAAGRRRCRVCPT